VLLIHGFRFHDAREAGVRGSLRVLLRSPPILDWLSSSSFRHEYPAAFSRLQQDIAQAETELKKEEGFEPRLVAMIGPYVPIFAQRELIYSHVQTTMRRVRDWAFHIDTTTKRPIIEQRYVASLQYVELLLRAAHDKRVAVFLYNAPLRAEVDNPYIAEQYRRFRDALARSAGRSNAVYEDYDDLIPRELWGSWYDTDFPDFSHFTARGHEILAERVKQDIGPLLDRNKRGKPASPGSEAGAIQ
jgi:hypothetical protein